MTFTSFPFWFFLLRLGTSRNSGGFGMDEVRQTLETARAVAGAREVAVV